MLFFHNHSPHQVLTRIVIASLAMAFSTGSLIELKAEDDARVGLGLSRFFRFGAAKTESKPAHDHNHDQNRPADIARLPSDRNFKSSQDLPASPATPFSPAVTSPGFGETSTNRVNARPRHNGPVTEADPILTRVGLGRSDSGSSFALFIQIYADGTVIDSEGVHRLPVSQIKQILAVIRGHDFSKVHGHCGQPSADFIENVQMVVYDRSMGRLRAHAFSYAGNPEGCDSSVGHLHKALDDLVMQISTGRPTETAATTISSPSTQPGTATTSPLGNSPNVTFSGSPASLPQLVESTQPVPSQPQPSNIPSFSQGALVPKLPATSTPLVNGETGLVAPR